ncbi:MAG: alkaline phosphatase family protein [Candidatus Brocadiia bacterium]
MKRFDKVIVLGIDGLDPDILGMLSEEGAVPNFDALRAAGCAGALGTVFPAQSPVVWTTLATGTNPAKHGVFDFIHRDPKRPLPYLSISRQEGGGLLRSASYVKPRQNDAFWDVLGRQGVPVSVIRWPVTFPAEEINGRMLSGLGVPGIRGTLGHYTLYTNDPASAPDVPPDRLMELSVSDGRAETVVEGPRVRGLRGVSAATIPLKLSWTDDGGVDLQAGQVSAHLAPGQWSDWSAMEFSAGALKTVRGIARFYLVSREPILKLYMTPLEPDPRDPAFNIASPDGYAAELAEAIGPYHTLGMPEDTKALNEGAMSEEMFVEQCNEVTEERFAQFWHEFERFDEGVLAFVFDTSDRIQHMFWRENGMDDDLRVARLSPRIREHYLLMDKFVGRLLEAMDGETGLVLVSDHGFASFDTCFDLNAWLVEEGFMTLTDDPAGMDEEETALYRLVDWSKTVAYGCGFSSLYVNLKGREGNGVVEPSEAPDVVKRLAERAAAYETPSGQAIVELTTRDDLYEGPLMDQAPDMVLSTAPGYRMGWQTAVGGVAPDVLSPNEKHWSGDHIVRPASVPGTIMSNVPLALNGASAHDLAPTVLAMLGLPAPAECDGASLLRDGRA